MCTCRRFPAYIRMYMADIPKKVRLNQWQALSCFDTLVLTWCKCRHYISISEEGYYWRTAEVRETCECGSSVSSSDFIFRFLYLLYTYEREQRLFGANYLHACSIYEASASWPWQKAASRKVAALTSNVNACLFSYTFLAYARSV